MEKEIFDKLFNGGELGVILSQGGANLTHEQLEMVRAASRVHADDNLSDVQRNADILRGIRMARGARYSDVMNDVTESYQQKFHPERITKAMSGSSKLKGKTDDKMKEAPDEEHYDKRKDPSITKVPPNTHMKLKKGDSEADILAKMLNLMQENYDKKQKNFQLSDRIRKEQDKEKEKQNDHILKALSYGKNRKIKEEPTDFKWLKYAAVGAIAGFGIFGSKEVHAKFKDLHKIKFPTIDELMSETGKKLESIKKGAVVIGTDVENLVEGTYDKLNLKSGEAVAGGSVTKELLMATEFVQKKHPEAVFTALNDLAHHKMQEETGHESGHLRGINADFKTENMSKENAAEIQAELVNQGFKEAKVIYEPPDKSGYNPQGHYHMSVSGTKIPKMQDDMSEDENYKPPKKTSQAPKMQLTPKTYVLEKTDKTVKDMQTAGGTSKTPNVTIVNETTNVMSPQTIKKVIRKINQDNWIADGVPPAIVKQLGGSIN